MPFLSWAMNMSFAAGSGAAQATTFIESVNDGQGVSIPVNVRDRRMTVGAESVRLRQEV